MWSKSRGGSTLGEAVSRNAASWENFSKYLYKIEMTKQKLK